MLAMVVMFGMAVAHTQAAANDSSVTIKKDLSSGLFVLTVRDPDGIQEFSLVSEGKLPYGGGLSGCKKSFSNDNVRFVDPEDFTPVMRASVIDCNNNTTELEVPPPVNGTAKGTALKKETLPPPPPPPQQPEEKKAGPLAAADIRYPVPDLGNCQSESACRSYCDNADRAKECLAFATKYHLISEQEAKESTDKFLNVKNGPGGCNGWSACEDYCNSIDHLDECIAFAEKTGYYPPEKIAEARKFQTIAKSGKQFPGGCKDRNACEIYCSVADHMDTCLAFAEETGFMPKEEIAEARKFMDLMRRGESPGNCASKEQCEKYCSAENHVDECVSFAEKAGVISAEDAAIARKTGGKGPGSCHSKGQCEAYCQAHSDECFNWAKENGLVSEGDLQKMTEGMKSFRKNLDKMPPEAVQCLKDAVGEENFNKIANGQPVFDRAMEEKMKSCFAQVTTGLSQQLKQMPPEAMACIKDAVGEDGLKKLQSGEFDEGFNFESLEGCFQQLQSSFGGSGNFGAGGFSGPGGCKTTEECMQYCTANPQKCQDFSPPGGGAGFQGGPPGSGGPGGENNSRNGFSECDITVGASAVYVCAVNGKGAQPGAETTYFNACHARQHGAQILHEGACKGHVSCSDIADPVCGTDGGNYTSECVAKEHGAGVKHKGVCTNEEVNRGGSGESPRKPSGNSGFNGPGGCKSKEECIAYCKDHLDDCRDFAGGGSESAPSSPALPVPVPPAPAQSLPPSGQIPQEYCAPFATVPKCDYVGAPDSQNYKYCKQCFPDK